MLEWFWIQLLEQEMPEYQHYSITIIIIIIIIISSSSSSSSSRNQGCVIMVKIHITIIVVISAFRCSCSQGVQTEWRAVDTALQEAVYSNCTDSNTTVAVMWKWI